MPSKTIFTIDARDNIFLESMRSMLRLDQKQIYQEINSAFESLHAELVKLDINYENLKNCLTPSTRKEIAYVFDSSKTDSSCYGDEIFINFIAALDKNSTNSVLCGDFISIANSETLLKTLFYKHIKTTKNINYIHNDLFFIIYLNNLSDQHHTNLDHTLNTFEPYIGYFDLTYSSLLKTYISSILVRLFIKHEKTIIAPYEESCANKNIYGYPFEDHGYMCKTVESTYFDLFLSYKIEREVFKGFEADTEFSLNTISDNVFDISEFKLIVEDKKLEYLLREKKDNIERAGLGNITRQEIEIILKNKLKNNYLYNLHYREESNTIKFNIIIETIRADKDQPMKLIAALEYIPNKRVLRLITLF